MSVCRRCLSVCLSAKKYQLSSYVSAKYVQTVQNIEKLLCLCFFLLDTLYKRLKSCVLSWHCGHAYRPHPDTWPPHETMVSVSLGFTTQRAFVRRQFAPILKEAHACIATWCRGVSALQSSSSLCIPLDNTLYIFPPSPNSKS